MYLYTNSLCSRSICAYLRGCLFNSRRSTKSKHQRQQMISVADLIRITYKNVDRRYRIVDLATTAEVGNSREHRTIRDHFLTIFTRGTYLLGPLDRAFVMSRKSKSGTLPRGMISPQLLSEYGCKWKRDLKNGSPRYPAVSFISAARLSIATNEMPICCELKSPLFERERFHVFFLSTLNVC